MEDESVLPLEENIPAQTEPVVDSVADVKDSLNETPAQPEAVVAAGGNETPAHANGYAEDAPALEETPAAISGEDSIR